MSYLQNDNQNYENRFRYNGFRPFSTYSSGYNYNPALNSAPKDSYVMNTKPNEKKNKSHSGETIAKIALAIGAAIAMYKGHGLISRGVHAAKARNAAFKATHQNFSIKGVGRAISGIFKSIGSIFQKTTP